MKQRIDASGLAKTATVGNSPGTGEPSGAQLERVVGERDWPPPLPARLAPFVADYVDFAHGLASDKGGVEALTTVRRGQIELAAEIRTLRRKCGRNLLARGLVRRNGELRDAVHTYVALANAEARTLRDLGAEREARSVQTLDEYLRGRRAGGPPGDDRSDLEVGGRVDTDRPSEGAP